MKKFLFSFLLAAGLCVVAFRPGADSLLDKLIAQLQAHNQMRPQEKLFLHLDRPQYMVGDTIRAQAYLTDRNNQPRELSKLIHVQLENARGIVVRQWQLPVKEGFATASLPVPEDLSGGLYRLRAFTQWMRNFDERAFFSAYLPIQDAKASHSFSLQKTTKPVQFFPEGGPLVRKLLSRIAVRTQDASGKPTSMQGRVINDEGTVISRFATSKNGLGEFELEPQFGEDYAVVFEGMEERFPLKNIKSQGTVMRVDNSDTSRITVLVQSNEPMMNAIARQGLLVVYAQGSIIYAAECVLGSKRFVANFPRKDLPVGLAQLVLFNGKGEWVAKRNIFTNPKKLQASVETDQETYAPRDPVKIQLKLANTLSGQFSISVRKKYPYPHSSLLSLSQQIEQISLFGEKMPMPDRENEIDQWMMGTDLLHVDWDEIMEESMARPEFLAQQGPLLRGQVWHHVQPEPHCNLTAFVGEHHFSYKITTDAEGKFDVPVVDYEGEATLLFVPESEEKNLTVVLDRQSATSFDVQQRLFEPEEKSYWQQQAIRLEACHDYATEQKKEALQRFYRICDLVVKPEDYVPLPNMAEVFREIVPTVQVQGRPGNYSLHVIPDDEIGPFDEEPLLLIDGWATFDPRDLLSLAPEEVDRIEVLHDSTSFKRLGPIGMHGVIAVYTRSRDFRADRQGLVFDRVPGIHRGTAFHSLAYPTVAARKSTFPDFRSTAYWNPKVSLNPAGKTEIEFYLGDDLGLFEIDVQGLTHEGLPFSMRKVFEVK